MTIVRVGTNKKYSEGWDAAFVKGSKKKAVAAKPVKSAKKKATKKPAKKKK